MPDLTLSFVNPRLLDDVSFHPCVRFKRWEVRCFVAVYSQLHVSRCGPAVEARDSQCHPGQTGFELLWHLYELNCQRQVGRLAKNVNCLNKGLSCQYVHQNLPIRGWKCRAGCSASFLRPLGPDMSICGAWSHSPFWMVTHLSMNELHVEWLCWCVSVTSKYVVFTQNYMKVPLLELHESSFISTGVQ